MVRTFPSLPAFLPPFISILFREKRQSESTDSAVRKREKARLKINVKTGTFQVCFSFSTSADPPSRLTMTRRHALALVHRDRRHPTRPFPSMRDHHRRRVSVLPANPREHGGFFPRNPAIHDEIVRGRFAFWINILTRFVA